MILVVYGTTGELIKLAPVLLRLRARAAGYIGACTGQQVTQIPTLLDRLNLPQPDIWLARGASGGDLRTNRDIPRWTAEVWRTYVARRGALRRRLVASPGKPLVLVHGDTFTTAFGAAMGRLLGLPVAHLEAGLRSFNLRHPFPEELDRRLTSGLATLHYAPGDWAASNLRRGTVVNTGSNTIRDSLELAPLELGPQVQLPPPPFGLVSLHRFELLNDRRLLESTLRLVADHADGVPLLFVEHAVTMAAIESYGLDRILDVPHIHRIPRLNFLDFVPVMRRSAFVLTDSGGNQEETYYLDIPCLVHRKATERQEGLGENVVLSGYQSEVVRAFLANPQRHRRRSPLPAASPSDVVVSDLVDRGFAGKPAVEGVT